MKSTQHCAYLIFSCFYFISNDTELFPNIYQSNGLFKGPDTTINLLTKMTKSNSK